jgi:EAL domain-containing protein (putative c-di-GMP-specific phosphodiesterase class I)
MENKFCNLDSQQAPPSEWFLCGQVTDQEPVREIPIHSATFTVGRKTGSSLCLAVGCISSKHAELEVTEHGELVLRDLGSTNGTFVNGKKIVEEVRVAEGDLIQFASLVFRVGSSAVQKESQTVAQDTHDRALAMMQFDRLISEGGVYPFFQPLVDLSDRSVMGYEILGRSRLFGLQTPGEMFHAASQLDLEAELSEVFRLQGIYVGKSLPAEKNLFVNTHPKELGHPRLYDSLKALREADTERLITLEIHEGATTDLKMMIELQAVLRDLDMQLAFDDFGVGQARLVELAEVRPEYLKFDMKLTQNIEQAPKKRQEVVALFAKMVKDLGIQTLAEGVETEACHEILIDMGFDLGQGYLYGKPRPIDRYDGKGSIIETS